MPLHPSSWAQLIQLQNPKRLNYTQNYVNYLKYQIIINK